MKFHITLFVSWLNMWKMVTVNKKLSLSIQITLINCIKSVEINTRGHRQTDKVRLSVWRFNFCIQLFFFTASDL